MKTILHPNSRPQGHFLLIAMMAVGLISFILVNYLKLVQSQNAAVARSQVWNSAVPVFESGIEDALTHMNTHGRTNMECDGWTKVGLDQYQMTRYVGENYYTVTITNFVVGSTSEKPAINSIACISYPATLASSGQGPLLAQAGAPDRAAPVLRRGVRVATTRNGLFTKAMVARGSITISGNVLTDSYDSTNPLYSSNGLYTASRSRDKGDVASNGALIKEINTSDGVVLQGHISTGPGGTVGMSGTVSIGDKAWIEGGNSGIKPGWFKDDMNVAFPDVTAPFVGGAFTPSGGIVGGTNYAYVLDGGNYQLGSMSLGGVNKVMVTGKSVLYVTGNLNMSGQAAFIIAPGASLKLYVAGARGNLTGQGVMNQTGFATNFVYYGLPTNTRVDLTGGSGFTGIIYAPQAALNVSGGSILHGATISDTVSATGGFKFHYDESLASFDNGGNFIVTSWNELSPSEVDVMMKSKPRRSPSLSFNKKINEDLP
jgi:hypothetical protein